MMRRGILLELKAQQGFGVIKDENEQDILFCLNEVSQEIKPGMPLQFEIMMSAHGLIAQSVMICSMIMELNF